MGTGDTNHGMFSPINKPLVEVYTTISVRLCIQALLGVLPLSYAIREAAFAQIYECKEHNYVPI